MPLPRKSESAAGAALAGPGSFNLKLPGMTRRRRYDSDRARGLCQGPLLHLWPGRLSRPSHGRCKCPCRPRLPSDGNGTQAGPGSGGHSAGPGRY